MSSKLKLGKFDVKANISGIDLILPTELSIQVETEVDRIVVTSESTIDLVNLQGNILPILRSNPFPPISGYGPQCEVTSLDSANLNPLGDSAVLEVGISCSVWEISKGLPYPVEHTKKVCIDIPFVGEQCGYIPDGVTFENGADIKLHLFNEGASAKVRFGLVTSDNKSIDILQLETEVYPRGELGKFTNWLLTFIKGDLSHFATGQLRKIINDGSLRQTMPKNLDKYNPLVKTIQFVTLATGSLGLFCSFEASLTEDELGEIIGNSIQ